MKKYTPEEEVQLTLESLDRLQRVDAAPGLYEKVMVRVNEPSVKIIPLYQRWQVAAAAILLIINTFSISLYINKTSKAGQENYYEALAEDYSLSLTQDSYGY